MSQRSQNFIDLFNFISSSRLIYDIEKTFDLDEETFADLKDRLQASYPIAPLEVKNSEIELQNDPKQQTKKSNIEHMKKWRNEISAYLKRALGKDLIKNSHTKILLKSMVERINYELQIWKIQPISLE